MPDPITDDGNNDDPGQTNPLSENWYDSFAGDDPDRREALGKFESFDDFFADYNSAKNADWRDPIAGDDEKFKAQLKRYADPASFGNAHREAVQKIRSGQLKEELPADATEEQIKEYRRANNIPLEPTGWATRTRI